MMGVSHRMFDVVVLWCFCLVASYLSIFLVRRRTFLVLGVCETLYVRGDGRQLLLYYFI